MVISAIDIGTNTILMASIRVDADGAATILGDEHAIARLGQGVDASRRISDAAMDRAVQHLNRYSAKSQALRADYVVAFGTSAVRDAANADQFIDYVAAHTGITVRVLTGREEAELTFRGALFDLEVPGDSCAVLDIGGGSTELAVGSVHGGVARAVSVDVGAVRITERFLEQSPPSSHALAQARAWAASGMATIPVPSQSDVSLVGVAGTVTTLGALCKGLDRFDADELNGYRMTIDDVHAWGRRLAGMTTGEIAALPPVHPDRADVLLGGTVILETAMRHLDATSIVVSTRGLRYGVALAQFEHVQSQAG